VGWMIFKVGKNNLQSEKALSYFLRCKFLQRWRVVTRDRRIGSWTILKSIQLAFHMEFTLNFIIPSAVTITTTAPTSVLAAVVSRIARWFTYFQTKNPHLGKFSRALDWKLLVNFMAIWNILWTF
jgi:uncharacterized membrane protein